MLVHHTQFSFGRIWFGVPGWRLGYFPAGGQSKHFGWRWVKPEDYHNCWLHGD